MTSYCSNDFLQQIRPLQEFTIPFPSTISITNTSDQLLDNHKIDSLERTQGTSAPPCTLPRTHFEEYTSSKLLGDSLTDHQMHIVDHYITILDNALQRDADIDKACLLDLIALHYSEQPGDWRDTLSSFDTYYTAVRHTQVPQPLCKLIYRAMLHTPNRSQALAHLTNIFEEPPTFDEFCSYLRTLKNNSSSGILGYSYNMIKSWPEPTLRAAYDCIALFWTNRDIPNHWKWRWLIPIPKKPTDTPLMDDRRPLTLTEATRKIWTGMIVDRIQKASTAYHTLRKLYVAAMHSAREHDTLLSELNGTEQLDFQHGHA